MTLKFFTFWIGFAQVTNINRFMHLRTSSKNKQTNEKENETSEEKKCHDFAKNIIKTISIFFFLVSNPFFFILVVLNDYKIILLFTFPRNASVTTKDVVPIPDNTNGWTLLVASVMKGFSVPTMNCCLVTLFPSY